MKKIQVYFFVIFNIVKIHWRLFASPDLFVGTENMLANSGYQDLTLNNSA